jgi:DNA-binding MarR family transcriptional regulator
MKKQQPVLVIDNPEAARAVREAQFLGYFLEPSSPSDVAKRANVAANLMHHHANRFLELGLIFEVKREDRKVFYQLTAQNFRVPKQLLPADEEMAQGLQELSSAFSKAYERSDRLNLSPDYLNFGFADTIPEDQERPSDHDELLEARPAHYQMRSFRISPSSYRRLVCQLADLIIDAETESSKDGAQCTIALMAFEGSVLGTPLTEGWEMLHMKSHVPGVRMVPIDQAST